MRIRLITLAHKAPKWIEEGYQEYSKRFPSSLSLELVELTAEKRGSQISSDKIKEKEEQRLLQAINPKHLLIALDEHGKHWDTAGLAKQLESWQQSGKNIDLVIGGADGLSGNILKQATQTWSLSKLTFPHMLVRVIVAEQLYRANSLLNNHPYHRS